MSFDTSWDIMKYKYSYEMENHWKLKERFLLAHKKKFAEEELICLAQTFYNIEVMGCTYDEDLMSRIHQLSIGLTDKNLRANEEAYIDASSAICEKVKARMHLPDDKSGPPARKDKPYISFVKAGATFEEGGTYEEPRQRKTRKEPPPKNDPIVIEDDDDDVVEVKEPPRTLNFKFIGSKDSKVDIPDLEELMGVSFRGEKRSGEKAGFSDRSPKRPITQPYQENTDEREHFKKGRDDHRPQGRDEYRPQGRDDYKPQGRDEYRPQGRDEYKPQGRDEYKPLGRDEYKPLGRDDYKPQGRDEFKPLGRDDYKPQGRDDHKPPRRDENRPQGRDDNRSQVRDDNWRQGRDDNRPHGRDDTRQQGRDDNKPQGRDDKSQGRDDNKSQGRDDNWSQGRDDNWSQGRDDNWSQGRDNRPLVRDNNRPQGRDGKRPVRGYETVRQLGYTASQVMDSGPFGRVVLFESAGKNEVPAAVIQRTASACHFTTEYTYMTANNKTICRMLMNGIFLANGEGISQKAAKDSACQIAIQRLKETSFTVQVKAAYIGSSKVNRSMERTSNSASLDKPLECDNIGRKLMKLMGWSGGGLGKNEQGIEEPVRPTDRSVTRSGLGIENFRDFKRKAITILEDFTRSDSKEDLVFSSDFSKEERKLIHELVRKYNLKSRSFGKEEDARHIVVFKRITPREIVEELIDCGGETDKYMLIPPTSIVP